MTTGVWLIGARGNVASLSMAGARAIARGVVDSTGMVTASSLDAYAALVDEHDLSRRLQRLYDYAGRCDSEEQRRHATTE
ncbi:hypothetical protein BRC91_12030 [Halobacteriales archaeon QS_4_62_28]|nr:MAG: hypothetical protein BRC91_12030 [Halobacteriales archaeon QS_4_62_28]